jgi:hypothetical protein
MILDIIDISVSDNYSSQDRLVPDERQNHHSHCRWDRQMWMWCYYKGYRKPHYPVPAIDYYSSTKREHIPIGNVMEWYFDVGQTIYHRGDK